MPVHPDLHLHSAYSDGLYAPSALCAMAQQAKLTHFSLCDHDTLAGLAPMREAVDAFHTLQADEGKPRIIFLPGLEMSAGSEGSIHVLGYGAEPDNESLGEWLDSAQKRRHERFDQMLGRLLRLGYTIPEQLLPPKDTALPLGRAHLARALVQMGVVNTLTQAFDRFLGRGKPAYVAYEHMSATNAVQFLRKAHVVPVLAHPSQLRMSEEELFALVADMQDEGLMGLEVFHPSASRSQAHSLEAFARRRKLLVTGGSDFHGDQSANVHLGELPGEWPKASEDILALMSAIKTA